MPPEEELQDEEEVADSNNSSDEALLDMLGLPSMGSIPPNAEEHRVSPLPVLSDSELQSLAIDHGLMETYKTDSVCILPHQCSISAEHMRRLTEELVWGGDGVQADRTYETVSVYNKQKGEVYPKKCLTRLEHFVDAHPAWSELCHNYLRRAVSAALGMKMVLYKEKLNLKPPGGSGFAPHLDTPSLRVALGPDGPQEFCTVMVAIDDMNAQNGCLRVCKGEWSEDHCVETIAPEDDGNPDAGGRAGAIPLEIAEGLHFEDLVCRGGTIAVFNGWAPHRSASNTSPFPRRAVFLTYNPKDPGSRSQIEKSNRIFTAAVASFFSRRPFACWLQSSYMCHSSFEQ